MDPEVWQIILQEAGIELDIRRIELIPEDCLIHRVLGYLQKTNQLDQSKSASASVYNEMISVANVKFMDSMRSDHTADRSVKPLFMVLANVRNLMADNKLVSLGLLSEQKNVAGQINYKDVAAAAVSGIKDSLSLHLYDKRFYNAIICKGPPGLPALLANSPALAKARAYLGSREKAILAIKNIEIEAERKINTRNNFENVHGEPSNLDNTAPLGDFHTTGVIVKEIFEILNKCSNYLFEEIAKGAVYRHSQGKKIFED